ncbi:MAG: Transcriptional regulator, MarR family [Solirubrobacterales bacterium]|jgi:DNA-binding MarR family transcriptional regulator|nr:Transcriptional regulator, MarR family [Solirubrobacterales bacterium]
MAIDLPTDPATEAWTLLSRIMMARKGHMLETAAAFELSPPQMWALRHLEPGTPLPMSALAELLHCDNSNVTGIVDRLESRGLVERRPAAHDRRVKHLIVTEAGARVREEVGARMNQPPPGFENLTPDEQRRLATLLRKVAG